MSTSTTIPGITMVAPTVPQANGPAAARGADRSQAAAHVRIPALGPRPGPGQCDGAARPHRPGLHDPRLHPSDAPIARGTGEHEGADRRHLGARKGTKWHQVCSGQFGARLSGAETERLRTALPSGKRRARPTGLEPVTSCSGGTRSIQLSYGRRGPQSSPAGRGIPRHDRGVFLGLDASWPARGPRQE